MADSHAESSVPKIPPNATPSAPSVFFRQNLRDELFDHEWEALQNMKNTYPELCSKFDDRFIMACLFSRKLKLDRTVLMLEANFEWRKHHGFEEIPDWYSLNRSVLADNFAYTIPGARTKDGHGIIYARFANMLPSDHENFVSDILNYMMWNNMVGILTEDMDYHRNGAYFVADFKSVGWKNWSIKLQSTVTSALMDKFPLRINRLLCFNPPVIFKAILAAAKLVVKKKLVDRVQLIRPEEVTKYIDKSQLSSEFGGDIDFNILNMFDYFDQVMPMNPPPKNPVKIITKRQVVERRAKHLIN